MKITNEDNMVLMDRYQDNYFDLYNSYVFSILAK